MVTMREIAKHAGVSIATVSRVINGTGFVSPELEQRVRDTMAAFNYQPSALARGLRRQETFTVGVLVPQIDHPFFGGLVYAIEQTLFEADYRTFVCSAEEDQVKENAYIAMLLQQRVDGIILAPTGRSSISQVEVLLEKGVPVVLVDRDLPGLPISRVLSHNAQGAYTAVHHLLELGHRRIGVIGGPAYSHPMQERLDGIRRAFHEAELELDPSLIAIEEGDQFELGHRAASRMLQGANPPTAIFALTDVMAVGVLHAAAEIGISVPASLSVIGFDNIPLASYSIPKLTTVAQQIREMGKRAAEILLEQIRNPAHEPVSERFDTPLIVRDSTAPPEEGASWRQV